MDRIYPPGCGKSMRTQINLCVFLWVNMDTASTTAANDFAFQHIHCLLFCWLYYLSFILLYRIELFLCNKCNMMIFKNIPLIFIGSMPLFVSVQAYPVFTSHPRKHCSGCRIPSNRWRKRVWTEYFLWWQEWRIGIKGCLYKWKNQ